MAKNKSFQDESPSTSPSIDLSSLPPLSSSATVVDDLPEAGEAERLRLELAQKETELDRLRSEIARRDAALQPLGNSGPGKYRVVLRHSPSHLKRFEVDAENEADAWHKYLNAAMKAAYNPKDQHQRAVKAMEDYMRQAKQQGHDRCITKVA